MVDLEILKKALDAALSNGASFAEIFLEDKIVNSLTFLDGGLEKSMCGRDHGAGIRLFYGTRCIFACTNDTSENGLVQTALTAAKAYSEKRGDVVLNLTETKLKSPHNILIPVTEVCLKDKVELLRRADKKAREYDSIITQVEAGYADVVQHVTIANSEGLFVKDTRTRTNLGVNVIATFNGEKQTGGERYGASKGFELYEKNVPERIAEEAARQAVVMAKAEYCPAREMPCVIESGFGGVIFHEACGHALETTSVAKGASVFADKMGQKIASDCVTAIDDGTTPNEWGSTVIDDEGTPTQKTVLIENGILKSFMVDKLGGLKLGLPSTGSGRRESYTFAPTSRMRNTYIAPGKATLEKMLEGIEFGLYAKKMGGGSVQPGTGQFNFGVSEGYLIEKGKITRPVRGGALVGSGQEILMRIEMVGANLGFSIGMCGSISGSVPANCGQPAIKVSKLTVGGRS